MAKFFGLLFVVFFVLFFAVGWGLNLVHVIQTVNDPIAGAFILRIVGIFFFPLGGIFGWFL